jgi:hypothetical protein
MPVSLPRIWTVFEEPDWPRRIVSAGDNHDESLHRFPNQACPFWAWKRYYEGWQIEIAHIKVWPLILPFLYSNFNQRSLLFTPPAFIRVPGSIPPTMRGFIQDSAMDYDSQLLYSPDAPIINPPLQIADTAGTMGV